MQNICLPLLMVVGIYCASVSWSQTRNSDFVTGEYILNAPSGALTFGDYNYYSPLYYVPRSIQTIHYITSSISIFLDNSNDPNNASQKRIEYYLDPQNYSNTHLNTRLRGYVQNPMINSITFRYLIILSNSSLFDSYITSNRVEFIYNNSTVNISTVTTPLPIVYTSISAVTALCFLSDMMVVYPISLQTNRMEIGVGSSISNGTLISSIIVSPYFYS